jgi:ATP-dependent RNA helicase RhlE
MKLRLCQTAQLRYDAPMKKKKEEGFEKLNIAPRLLKELKRNNFVVPTLIQRQAIPVGVKGVDLIGVAQTGTGKTLAFAIPLIQRVFKLGTQGLVVCPTRELAMQVEENLKLIGGNLGLKTALILGGAAPRPQMNAVKAKPHIIVATPGRLIDFVQKKVVNLQRIKVVVLDEADRMLDMGFEPQIKIIMAGLPKQRQVMLFSATMPERITRIANKYMAKPLHIEVAPAGSTTDQVVQELFFVKRQQKMALLVRLLSDYDGTILVFSRTKHGARKMTMALKKRGLSVAEIHSNRSLNQRKEALAGFKDGKYRVLIATDIAARGIDVQEIELVINYDLPQNSEDYVHRIGRTGRAAHIGKAISFACPEQGKDVKAIERLINLKLKQLPLPRLPQLFNDAEIRPRRVETAGGVVKRGGRSGKPSKGKRHKNPRVKTMGRKKGASKKGSAKRRG